MPPSTSPTTDTPADLPGETAGILHPGKAASIPGVRPFFGPSSPALMPATRADVDALAAPIAALEQQNAALVRAVSPLAMQVHSTAHALGLALAACQASGLISEQAVHGLLVAASAAVLGVAGMTPEDHAAWNSVVNCLHLAVNGPQEGEAPIPPPAVH